MNFNFNSLSEQTFTSNAGQYLRPYEIYPVKLTKIEKTELKGSKDPNSVYPVVALEFTGCGENKGKFTTNLFIPNKEDDLKRPVYKNAEGHEYEGPSSFETFQYTLMQIVHELNPGKPSTPTTKATGECAIKEVASMIKSIDQFIDLIIKALRGKENVETHIKLIGRNNNGNVYAALPRACGVNREGAVYARKFIGDNLTFDNYELSQMKQYQNAKPTTMSDTPDTKASDDVDLDDIEL